MASSKKQVSDVMVSELRLLAESITSMVERARASRSSYTLQQFVNADRRKENAGIYLLYPVQEYVRCFRALGVRDRAELETLCKRRYAETEVREAFDDFMQSEDDFGDFIAEVDREVKTTEDKMIPRNILSVGSTLPGHLELLDADFNRIVSLGETLTRSACTLFVFKRHYV